MQEPRTAVMLLAEASWKDPDGGVQTVPARVEDRSPGGACLRLGRSVVVGTRLVVQTRREQFSGAARYCRTDGRDYVVGIQKDEVMIPILSQQTALPKQTGSGSAPPTTAAEIPQLLMKPPGEGTKTPPAKLERDSSAASPAISSPEVSSPLAREPRTEKALQGNTTKVCKARKPMRNKLLELAHWHHKPDGPLGNGNGNGDKQGEAPHPSDPPATRVPIVAAANFEAELLPVEDIYRTAGVMNVRHGIHRVVEMLHSEHLRGLSKDMKRAAVMMALDAAGIPIEQVLQDCKVRQAALDTYEASQKKQVEAEWARKAEENVQIQAELDRVKEHYMTRIARNIESVEREKATFSDWLTKKQQESQSIADAADLFAQTAVPENSNAATAGKP